MYDPPASIGPHQGQSVDRAGLSLDRARAAMVMIHGRGATAESILTLAPTLGLGSFAFLAPQAAGNTWYPNSFLAPIPSNEPGISSGLQVISDVLAMARTAGIPNSRIIILGFSQGACLSVEFAARNALRYGGIACLSGGLIGPAGTLRDYTGDFAGMPAFFGCSDIDSHVPALRVQESAQELERMKARVTTRLYPGMGHLINDNEIATVQEMMEEVTGSSVT